MNKDNTNKDSLIKGVGTVLLGIIVLALFYNLFFTQNTNMYPGGFGFQAGGEMHMGNAGMGWNQATAGFSLGSLLAGILMLLIKILSILLVVGLILGIWLVVKDYIIADGQNPLSALSQSFMGVKMKCPKCSSTVDNRWDFCPDCGQALTKDNKTTDNQVQNENNA